MTIYCRNCNQYGHLTVNCVHPQNSYGVIIYVQTPDGVKLLMIQRRYSHMFIEFIYAKYIGDREYFINLIRHLPESERRILLTKSFKDIWTTLHQGWVTEVLYDKEYQKCKQTFEEVYKKLSGLFDKYPALSAGPNWEFPKGRRDNMESNLDCALRECYEESGLKHKEDYMVYQHLTPFVCTFYGINDIQYSTIYYLGEVTNLSKCAVKVDMTNSKQYSEVQNIGWFSIEEVLENYRTYSEQSGMIETIKSAYQVIQKMIEKREKKLINYIQTK